MTVAIFYLDKDPTPAKEREFHQVAMDLAGEFGTLAHGIHTGEHVLRTAEFYEPESVTHLLTVCHGFTTRLLSAKAGVHITQSTPPAVVSLMSFIDAWAPKLARNCKVSLCSCMCAQTPRSYESYWGPWSHTNGGLGSFAAKLRDGLLARGVLAEVRGHTTPGHVTRNPACRVFLPKMHEEGKSLFMQTVGTLPKTKPTWSTCRKFNNLVKGELASRWITFDDSVLPEIVASWA